MVGILIVLLGLAPSFPWTDEPRVVTFLDMEAEFRPLPREDLYVKLCARAAGDRGTDAYRHVVEASIESGPTETPGCRSLRIDAVRREGAYPSFHLNLAHPDRRIPARRIYLLSDGFRWFLYLSGSSPGDIFEYHDGEVLRIQLWDGSDAGRQHLDIGFATKCRGHVVDDDSDCYDCETWKNQGRNLGDLRGHHDSIHRCIRNKLLDAGPSVIRWSKNNSQCFIDYSACVN